MPDGLKPCSSYRKFSRSSHADSEAVLKHLVLLATGSAVPQGCLLVPLCLAGSHPASVLDTAAVSICHVLCGRYCKQGPYRAYLPAFMTIGPQRPSEVRAFENNTIAIPRW